MSPPARSGGSARGNQGAAASRVRARPVADVDAIDARNHRPATPGEFDLKPARNGGPHPARRCVPPLRRENARCADDVLREPGRCRVLGRQQMRADHVCDIDAAITLAMTLASVASRTAGLSSPERTARCAARWRAANDCARTAGTDPPQPCGRHFRHRRDASEIQAAGAPGGGTSASPNTLAVLV
mgnify:CR=1 FL=1